MQTSSDRAAEVCRHALYLLWERKARGLDRVAGESSFVIHFQSPRTRREIGAVRRYLWRAEGPAYPARSETELLRLRQESMRPGIFKSLQVDREREAVVATSQTADRWGRLLLGYAQLLLAAGCGLPARLPAIWYVTTVSQPAGVKDLYSRWTPDMREARLIQAYEEGRPWQAERRAIVVLRLFASSSLKHVMDTYEAARDMFRGSPPDELRHLFQGGGVSFDVECRFPEEVPHIKLTVSSSDGPLPASDVLRSWLRACLARWREDLQVGGTTLTDDALRLWTSSTLVDFAGLSNRDAMRAWDSEMADKQDLPPWGLDSQLRLDAGTTQSPEISFANSRREVVRPRSAFYVSLLESGGLSD